MPSETEMGDNVGYCKPPKQHQFKRGQSGNPKGRPKWQQTVPTFRSVLLRKIKLTENGKQKTMTLIEAIHHQMVGRVLNGKAKSAEMKVVIEEMRSLEKGTFVSEYRLSVAGEKLIEEFVKAADAYDSQA